MGGHGGLNILPQKRWNVYNYENREKVRRDEEAAAREEQLAREQSRKRDAESRLQKLRQLRGLAPPSEAVKAEESVQAEPEAVEAKSDSKHINLFEGIKIFDPIEIKEGTAPPRVNKKMKKEEVRVVTAEDEKYRLGYGIVGKGSKLPWYILKPSDNEADKCEKDDDSEEDDRRVEIAKKSSGKKSLEELREERLKRERKEKERERGLLMEKSRMAGGFSSRRRRG